MSMKPEAILGIGRQFMESRVFLTAAELDIFSLLVKDTMSAEEVADRIQATVRGVTILLDALAAMGLLEKKERKYHCPEEAVPFLSKDSPASIMPMVRLMTGGWKRWSDLTEIVRRGTKKTRPLEFDGGESEQEAFIRAMHVIAYRAAPGIVAAVKPGKAEKLLDIGGGSGSYTQAFLEAFPGMSATLFDLPKVIALAKKRLALSGVRDRITFVAGDFYKDELPAGHDIALLSAVIHQNSPGQNIELYRTIHRALRPGGRLVIRDHVMSPDHTRPARGALFAVNMLVVTPGGSTYSFDEIREGLKAAGFENIRLIQPDEQMNGLVEAFG